MGREAAGWVVTCPAYEVGPFKSRAIAERRMAEVEAQGACSEEHRIEAADA